MADVDTIENDTREKARDYKRKAEDFKNSAQDTWEDFVDVVRKHPGKALSIALATGVAVGVSTAAFSRRRSAGDQLRDLASSGTDAFGRVRKGFKDAVDTLKCAIEEAAEDLK